MWGFAPNDTKPPVLSADFDHTALATSRSSLARLTLPHVSGCGLELREAGGPPPRPHSQAELWLRAPHRGVQHQHQRRLRGDTIPTFHSQNSLRASLGGPSTSPLHSSSFPGTSVPVGRPISRASRAPTPSRRAWPPVFLWPAREGAADQGTHVAVLGEATQAGKYGLAAQLALGRGAPTTAAVWVRAAATLSLGRPQGLSPRSGKSPLGTLPAPSSPLRCPACARRSQAGAPVSRTDFSTENSALGSPPHCSGAWGRGPTPGRGSAESLEILLVPGRAGQRRGSERGPRPCRRDALVPWGLRAGTPVSGQRR